MTTLRPLLLDTRDGEWGKGEPAEGRVEMRVIRGTDFAAVREGQADVVPTRYLERRHADRKRLQPWDIVFETAGGSPDRPTGRTILLTPRTFEILGKEITCASFARFLRVDPEQADPAYVFWLLQHHYERRDLLQFHTQHTGVARFQFTTFSNTFELNLPPLDAQRRIASILGAYDDLIEVNRRRVVVLEKMAQGLFEEWFVRFRFPGHESVPVVETPDGPLPLGWTFTNLYDVAEVAFGFAFKSKAFTAKPEGSRVVRIRDVPDGTTSTWTAEPFDPRYAVMDGDILVGMDGIFHMNFWVGGHAALNQRVTRLRPTAGHSPGWLFRSVYPKIKHFEATISGTTVAHLGAKHLKTIVCPVADAATQQRADAYFSPIDKAVVELRIANQRLAASRDLLLPRLISGQLPVETAQRELELAA